MGMNKVMVAGIIAEKPKYYSDSIYGDVLEIKLDINRRDINRVERLTCYIINKNLIEKGLNRIQVGDYFVSMSGRLVSLDILRQKSIICPSCEEKSERFRRFSQTDIVLYEFHLTRGVSLENSVGINKVFLFGMIRSQVKTNRSVCKFQMILNRPLGLETHLRETSCGEVKIKSYDLPIITTFNSVSEKVREKTRQGDFVSIEGAIQESKAIRNIPFSCKYCGESSDQHFEFITHEVIAASVTPQRTTIIDIKEQIGQDMLENEFQSMPLIIREDLGNTSVNQLIRNITRREIAYFEKAKIRKERRKLE